RPPGLWELPAAGLRALPPPAARGLRAPRRLLVWPVPLRVPDPAVRAVPERRAREPAAGAGRSVSADARGGLPVVALGRAARPGEEGRGRYGAGPQASGRAAKTIRLVDSSGVRTSVFTTRSYSVGCSSATP